MACHSVSGLRSKTPLMGRGPGENERHHERSRTTVVHFQRLAEEHDEARVQFNDAARAAASATDAGARRSTTCEPSKTLISVNTFPQP